MLLLNFIFLLGLWALINNNCWAAFGEVEWVPLQVYERAADYNLFATIRSTQVFLPLLRKTQGLSTKIQLMYHQNL